MAVNKASDCSSDDHEVRKGFLRKSDRGGQVLLFEQILVEFCSGNLGADFALFPHLPRAGPEDRNIFGQARFSLLACAEIYELGK
jgi:hypothetical protein